MHLSALSCHLKAYRVLVTIKTKCKHVYKTKLLKKSFKNNVLWHFKNNQLMYVCFFNSSSDYLEHLCMYIRVSQRFIYKR